MGGAHRHWRVIVAGLRKKGRAARGGVAARQKERRRLAAFSRSSWSVSPGSAVSPQGATVHRVGRRRGWRADRAEAGRPLVGVCVDVFEKIGLRLDRTVGVDSYVVVARHTADSCLVVAQIGRSDLGECCPDGLLGIRSSGGVYRAGRNVSRQPWRFSFRDFGDLRRNRTPPARRSVKHACRAGACWQWTT